MKPNKQTKQKYRPAVFIVTYRKNKDKILYLILKRKLHWKGWEFPKGGIKKKETLLKTIKRELKEETQQSPTNIKNHKFSGKYKYTKQYTDRPGYIGQTFKLFSAQIPERKVKFDKHEHSNYKWKTFEKAIKKLTHPNQRKCLRIVDKSLNKK